VTALPPITDKLSPLQRFQVLDLSTTEFRISRQKLMNSPSQLIEWLLVRYAVYVAWNIPTCNNAESPPSLHYRLWQQYSLKRPNVPSKPHRITSQMMAIAVSQIICLFINKYNGSKTRFFPAHCNAIGWEDKLKVSLVFLSKLSAFRPSGGYFQLRFPRFSSDIAEEFMFLDHKS